MNKKELKDLEKDINAIAGNRYKFREVTRSLTKTEWRNLCKSIPSFAMLLHNTGIGGFSLGFSLYEAPQYPGLEPEFLIQITQHHIPVKKIQEARGDEGIETVYEYLSKFFKTERNLELLKFCDLSLPRSPSYYKY